MVEVSVTMGGLMRPRSNPGSDAELASISRAACDPAEIGRVHVTRRRSLWGASMAGGQRYPQRPIWDLTPEVPSGAVHRRIPITIGAMSAAIRLTLWDASMHGGQWCIQRPIRDLTPEVPLFTDQRRTAQRSTAWYWTWSRSQRDRYLDGG